MRYLLVTYDEAMEEIRLRNHTESFAYHVFCHRCRGWGVHKEMPPEQSIERSSHVGIYLRDNTAGRRNPIDKVVLIWRANCLSCYAAAYLCGVLEELDVSEITATDS